MEKVELSRWEEAFICRQQVARLATVDQAGQPHVIPIVYAFDGARLFTPIDAKPKKAEPDRLQRVRNIRANPQVGVIIDEYHQDWLKLAWVQIRGQANLVENGSVHRAGVGFLEAKYRQYAEMPLDDQPLIVIVPTYIVSWQAAEAS